MDLIKFGLFVWNSGGPLLFPAGASLKGDECESIVADQALDIRAL
jgi:hypothetical protein